MKTAGRKNFILTAVILSCLFCVCFKLLTITAETASNVPSIFINDSVFPRYKDFPLEIIDGVEYVPVTALGYIPELNNMKPEKNEDFLILYKHNRFVAFDVSENSAKDMNTADFECKTYILHQTRYVPAALICKSLGLDFESRPEYGTVRIKNSVGRKSFDELIIKYTEAETIPIITAPSTERLAEPTLPPPTEPTPPIPTTSSGDSPVKTTEPTTAVPTTTAEPTDEIKVYIIIDLSPDNETGRRADEADMKKINSKLNENGISALFMANDAYVRENPSITRDVYISGNSFAIKTDMAKLTEETSAKLLAGQIKTSLDFTNNFLYKLYKNKLTLFYIEDTRLLTQPEIINAKSLGSDGYYFVQSNLTSEDFGGIRKDSGYVQKLKEKRVNIIKLTTSEADLAVLDSVIRASKSKFYIKFFSITRTEIGS